MLPRATRAETAIPLLTYFAIRGRAEVIRLILEEAAVPYRERRVREQDWAVLKPRMPLHALASRRISLPSGGLAR